MCRDVVMGVDGKKGWQVAFLSNDKAAGKEC